MGNHKYWLSPYISRFGMVDSTDLQPPVPLLLFGPHIHHLILQNLPHNHVRTYEYIHQSHLTCNTVTGTGSPTLSHNWVMPILTAIAPVLRDCGVHGFLLLASVLDTAELSVLSRSFISTAGDERPRATIP